MVVRQQESLVSMIMRTQNRSGFLGEAVDSLHRQTYRPLELIFVNDSDDPLAKEVLVGATGFDVRQVHLKSRRGRSAAANAGLQLAEGKYVGFLDDDDILYPEHVERSVALLTSNPHLAGVYTDIYSALQEPDSTAPSGYRTIARQLPYCRSFDRELLFLDNYIPINAMTFGRESVNQIGYFDENLDVLEDWDFWIRMALEFDFCHLCQITGEFRVRTDNSASTHSLQSLFPPTRSYIYRKYADRTLPFLLKRMLATRAPTSQSDEVTALRARITELEARLAEQSEKLDEVTGRLRRYLNSKPLKIARAVRRMLLRLPPLPPDP
jgi:O-antigen biosynthesis protein